MAKQSKKTFPRIMKAKRSIDGKNTFPDLCIITGEDGGCYRGRWVLDFSSRSGEYLFPKRITRDLTHKEVKGISLLLSEGSNPQRS